MNAPKVSDIVAAQRQFFATGKTRPADYRREQLKKLADGIRRKEGAILAALKSDLNKSETEAFVAEMVFCLDEIAFTLKSLDAWMRPRKVPTPIVQAIGSSRIHSEPLGEVLIIGPWNYPFQLLICPLVGALSAGNCAMVKPSELAPATSRVTAELLREIFPENYVAVVEGGVEASTELLAERFDHIFFTGGTAVGKVVMAAAAKHLTPVTLELGGKSPCLVDKEADADVSARRITWGKFFNAGQTCVAPDYLLLPRGTKDSFLALMKKNLETFFGPDKIQSPDLGRIITERHYARLKSFLSDGKVYAGGTFDDKQRFLAPTILTDVKWDDRVMQEEIFGPILPVLEYDTLDEAIQKINARPKPLAFYFFSSNAANQSRVVREIPFGGGCINDTLTHLSNPRLPFGGVGESGMGAYHGQYSFDTFSHRKSVFKKTFFPDPQLRYPPYAGKLRWLRKLMG